MTLDSVVSDLLDSPFASRSGHKSFDLPLDALPAKPRAKDASKVTGRQQPRRWAADMDFRVDLSTDTSVPRNGTSSSHSASDEICYASVDKSVGSKVSEAAEHCSHTASSRSESSSSSRGSDRGGDGSAGSCNGVPAPAPPDVGVTAKAKGALGEPVRIVLRDVCVVFGLSRRRDFVCCSVGCGQRRDAVFLLGSCRPEDAHTRLWMVLQA